MKRWVSALTLAVAGSLALAGPAVATQSVTKQLPGMPCSVTSSYTFYLSARAMNYAGGVSCAGGAGQKTLNVVPQVYNVVNGKPLWFNISLASRYQGPAPVNPLRLSATRAAVIGHVYRVLAYGRVTCPTARPRRRPRARAPAQLRLRLRSRQRTEMHRSCRSPSMLAAARAL